jgi:hypothetical protein
VASPYAVFGSRFPEWLRHVLNIPGYLAYYIAGRTAGDLVFIARHGAASRHSERDHPGHKAEHYQSQRGEAH